MEQEDNRRRDTTTNPTSRLKQREFSIVYTNAQSVLKKMDELRCYVAERNPDMILLTETWTNDTVSDDFLKLKGYEIIARNDRVDTAGGRGGGVLVYARKEINCWKEEKESGFNQSVSVRVKIGKTTEMAVHVVLRASKTLFQYSGWIPGRI